MPNYYNEKAIIMPFLAKCDGIFSRKEQISALINIVDETTLKFILNLDLQEQGIEDFQKVIRFIKENQADIITQLSEQNLFYSRLNFAFVLPAFIGFVSAIPLMAATGFLPASALGVTVLIGFSVITAWSASSSIVYDKLAKQHLYEEIGQKLAHPTSNYKGFFNNEFFLTCETVNNLCNLPKILGVTS